MKIYAKDYGVMPGKTDVKKLENLLVTLRDNNDEKELVLDEGEYYIDSSKLKSRMFYITNTVGDKQFSSDETPHKNRAMLYLENVKNLKISGNSAVFIADGKATNFALEGCENVTVNDVGFSALKPDLHELRVVSLSAFYVDFQADSQSDLYFKKGKPYFLGSDYEVAVNTDSSNAHWIGLIRESDEQTVKRVSHPLFGALKVKRLDDNRFRVFYLNTMRFQKGDRYYLFDVRRQYAGIFMSKCKNVTLENVSQRFNYSLALVCQDCDTLNFNHLNFSPGENNALKMASIADFIQICMCRGEVNIKNSFFSGAGDDCLNTHGIHFKIIEKNKNEITVRFMHPQSHGFNPLRADDEIAFVNSQSLLECGNARIIKSELVNETDIKLTLDREKLPDGFDVIEDVDACPSLSFENNVMTRIITRGILYTSRGKCVIKNNCFISTSMSSILLSDDAKSWYESGMCKDVTIENNEIDYCGETPVLIKPENSVHNGAVHSNIIIKNNKFKDYKGACIKIKSTDNVLVSNNSYANNNHISLKNCTNITEK